jgi:hypothetical protein
MAVRRELLPCTMEYQSDATQCQIFGKNAKTKSSQKTIDQENSAPE